MAKPRRRDFPDALRTSPYGHVPTVPQTTARTLTATETQARYRKGHRAPGAGVPNPVWSERRNGLPIFRPYVYRGGKPGDGRML